MRTPLAALALVLWAGLAACTAPGLPPGPATGPATGGAALPDRFRGGGVSGDFVAVMERVRPVAIDTCLRQGRTPNCDFAVLVDDRPGLPPNAYYTLLPDGRPALGFTTSLIGSARNDDELAFIAGHEAAHHIAGHLGRTQVSGLVGAQLAGVLASLGGGDIATIERAQQMGAFVGTRRYAKDFELEADALGTVIAARAGYDPVLGAQYFARIPDPGNAFLGTHPPNGDRIDTVRRAAAGY